MSLLGLSNLTPSYPSQAVTPISPLKQVPERGTKTEAPQEAVKSPQYDSYTPSQEGLDYVKNGSAVTDTADSDLSDMAEVDNMDGSYGAPTTMPELEQAADAAIPDELIDPTDASNLETYDPSAWLEAYKDEKANPNTSEIGPQSGEAAADGEDQTVSDPSDASNLETYDPTAWLSNYRAEAEKAPTVESTTDVTVEDGDDVEADSGFDLQAFLAESDSVAQNVASQLMDGSTSYSNTENWLDLMESTKLFG